MQIKLKNTVFNINNRLKSIDNTFYLTFNTRLQRYEVHSSKQKNSFCFALPYNQLDARVLTYARKTSIKNLTNYLQEIQQHNEQKELNSIKDKNDYVKQQALDMLFFLQNSSKSANFSSTFAKGVKYET